MRYVSHIKIQSYLLISMLVFIAIPVFAAEISFDAKTREIPVGQQFQVDVLLNTENEEINAVEGEITFGSDALELKEIRDGNSFINFWIERPRAEAGEKIVFSGITPGGYKSDKGFIFSIIFLAKTSGGGTINFESLRVLKNDGQGTPAQVRISPYQFVIHLQNRQVSEKSKQSPIAVTKDTEPPEYFMPQIASNPTLFEGKQVLVFVTQDKKSGIDHYEIEETRQRFFTFVSKWISAESPHVLEDQELRSYVYVKAIDKAGNARVVNLRPKNPLTWYENCENWVMIVLGLAIAYAIRKFLWRKLNM